MTTSDTRPAGAVRRRLPALLRSETVAGILLLVAAAIAVGWANSPFAAQYVALREVRIGPAALDLRLTLADWTGSGLLALFFFLAGLELKREVVRGELRQPRRALVPVVAAVGGMVVPAGVFLAVGAGAGSASGWAIPTATDIAFSLALLAVLSTHLPAALRTFLLALAVVDDLLAIVVIAVFYTAQLHLTLLALALLPVVGFGLLAQLRLARWWNVVPLAVTAWALVHASGVHATVAGVLLAFTVPVQTSARRGPAPDLEHRLRPLSSAVVVPAFAFFAAGVTIGGMAALGHALTAPVTLGVILGLVVGKPVGVLAGMGLAGAALRSRTLAWRDAAGLALLCGIGFTVSLLLGELAFPGRPERVDEARLGVLVGSLLAGLLGAVVLRRRNRIHRARSAVPSTPTPAGASSVTEGGSHVRDTPSSGPAGS